MKEQTKVLLITIGIYAGYVYVNYKLAEHAAKEDLLIKVANNENALIIKARNGMKRGAGGYCFVTFSKIWKVGNEFHSETMLVVRPSREYSDVKRLVEDYKRLEWKKVIEDYDKLTRETTTTFVKKGRNKEEYRVRYFKL